MVVALPHKRLDAGIRAHGTISEFLLSDLAHVDAIPCPTHEFTIAVEDAQEYGALLHPLAAILASKKWE